MPTLNSSRLLYSRLRSVFSHSQPKVCELFKQIVHSIIHLFNHGHGGFAFQSILGCQSTTTNKYSLYCSVLCSIIVLISVHGSKLLTWYLLCHCDKIKKKIGINAVMLNSCSSSCPFVVLESVFIIKVNTQTLLLSCCALGN